MSQVASLDEPDRLERKKEKGKKEAKGLASPPLRQNDLRLTSTHPNLEHPTPTIGSHNVAVNSDGRNELLKVTIMGIKGGMVSVSKLPVYKLHASRSNGLYIGAAGQLRNIVRRERFSRPKQSHIYLSIWGHSSSIRHDPTTILSLQFYSTLV